MTTIDVLNSFVLALLVLGLGMISGRLATRAYFRLRRATFERVGTCVKCGHQFKVKFSVTHWPKDPAEAVLKVNCPSCKSDIGLALTKQAQIRQRWKYYQAQRK